jgi:hypothetical protein
VLEKFWEYLLADLKVGWWVVLLAVELVVGKVVAMAALLADWLVRYSGDW